jgi:hypothetical protein
MRKSECGLDHYFPLVVEAIEEADAKEYLACHVN